MAILLRMNAVPPIFIGLLTGVAFDYGLMERDLLGIGLWLSGIGLCLFLLHQAFVLWRTWR